MFLLCFPVIVPIFLLKNPNSDAVAFGKDDAIVPVKLSSKSNSEDVTPVRAYLDINIVRDIIRALDTYL